MEHSNASTIAANRAMYLQRAPEVASRAQQRSFMTAHLEALVRAAVKPGKQPVRVLDVGTGSGFGLSAMPRLLPGRDCHVIGCDISREALAIARQRSPHAGLAQFDGFGLPFADASFDLVLFLSVLHHVYEPEPLLRESARLIAPGGSILILQEPNPPVNGTLLWIRRWLAWMPPGDVVRAEYHQFVTSGLAPSRLTDALKSCGTTVSVQYSNAALADELHGRLGRCGRALGGAFMHLRHRLTCLSYSIAARRKLT